MKQKKWHIIQDFFIIAVSLVVALYLAKTDLVSELMGVFKTSFASGSSTYLVSDLLPYLGFFVAGMFFTSVFTTAPAIVVLGEFALHNNLAAVALLGGMGAVIGDFILFTFVKDRVAIDFKYIFQLSRNKIPLVKRLSAVFHARLFRFMAPFIGGLIIASPLPDELGVTILGLSKMNNRMFILLSFVFNTIGILVIGLVARAVF